MKRDDQNNKLWVYGVWVYHRDSGLVQVSLCSNFRPVHSEVRQFLHGTILTISSFSAARHIRWHTFSIRRLQPSFCRIYLYFKPHNLLVMTHAGVLAGWFQDTWFRHSHPRL
jgi:hypothetical protein